LSIALSWPGVPAGRAGAFCPGTAPAKGTGASYIVVSCKQPFIWVGLGVAGQIAAAAEGQMPLQGRERRVTSPAEMARDGARITIKTELTVSSCPLQEEPCEPGSSKMSVPEQCIKHCFQQRLSKSFLLNCWSHTHFVMES